ncbi:hypothetical protein F8C67_09450 [Phaeocystidibacter luteus]|uniref:Uncharacterized protein n=1 Tax=Phaeocystidibacter luteus TaxID=911197 RepID=A0A6N6RFD7_9FLAO|nr:hypothetical protein F8C67_09450 [Phaeocystidibacter luteus]
MAPLIFARLQPIAPRLRLSRFPLSVETSVQPTNSLTIQPSNHPTLQPSNHPTLQPSNPLTLQPSK